MLSQLNLELFKLINGLAGKNTFIDKLAIVSAKYLPIGFVVILAILWFGKKELKHHILYACYSALLGLLVNFTIAYFYFHPRPFMEGIGKLLVYHEPETSFPSDHTTFMCSIAFSLIFFPKTRKLGITLLILGIIGGLARVYCGLHWPFDVFGSIIIALFASCFVYLIRNKLFRLNTFIIQLVRI